MHVSPEDADVRGLVSYGPDALDMWARSADIVDKILRGRKPTHIPIEEPTKFALVVASRRRRRLVWQSPNLPRL